MTLDEHQKKELRGSIGPLEVSIGIIYKTRKPRQIEGDNGILVRTLGADFNGINSYQGNYHDSERGDTATEFQEFIEALEAYDRATSLNSRQALLDEAGDLIFQRTIIETKHKGNAQYSEATRQFTIALGYIEEQLQRRGLSIKTAEKIAQVKYGVRAYLQDHGMPGKDKGLEAELCAEVIDTS
jgi:hypothetical protein